MALFGVPLDLKNPEEQAVKSAIQMVEALEKSNFQLRKEGQSIIYIGVGINSGQVVAGNMGSSDRLNLPL